MKTQISLDGNSERLLRSLLEAKEKELEAQLFENPLYKEIQELRKILSQLDQKENENSSANSNESFSYRSNMPYSDKIEFVIRKLKGELTSSEIVDELMRIDPNLNRKTVLSNVSSVLFTATVTTKKRFDRRPGKNGEYVYFLKK